MTKDEFNKECSENCDLYDMCAVPCFFDDMGKEKRIKECKRMKREHLPDEWLEAGQNA